MIGPVQRRPPGGRCKRTAVGIPGTPFGPPRPGPRLDKAKGAVKDAAGDLTGDTKPQAEGKMDKAKGAVRTAIGDVKDALNDAKK